MPGFYDRFILPKLLTCACSSPPMMRQRAKVVPKATGRVLELGIGMGLNLGYYDTSQVSEVVGVDPAAELRALALAAPRPAGLKVEVDEGTAEALPFEQHERQRHEGERLRRERGDRGAHRQREHRDA